MASLTGSTESKQQQPCTPPFAFQHLVFPLVATYSSHANECNKYATSWNTFDFCSKTQCETHQHWPTKMSGHALECLTRFLTGGPAPRRDEKSVLWNFEQHKTPDLFGGGLVDYTKVANFSFDNGAIILPNSSNHYRCAPDFCYEGGLVETQAGNTYTWSCTTKLTKLHGRTSPNYSTIL